MQYELIFYWRSNHTPARHPQPIPEPSSSDSPTQLSTELNPIHHTVHMNGPVVNTRSVSVITDEGYQDPERLFILEQGKVYWRHVRAAEPPRCFEGGIKDALRELRSYGSYSMRVTPCTVLIFQVLSKQKRSWRLKLDTFNVRIHTSVNLPLIYLLSANTRD